MIIEPQQNQYRINVVLKNGETFMDKDITSRPFGESERLVAFWHEGKIRTYPMANVEYMELVPHD